VDQILGRSLRNTALLLPGEVPEGHGEEACKSCTTSPSISVLCVCETDRQIE